MRDHFRDTRVTAPAPPNSASSCLSFLLQTILIIYVIIFAALVVSNFVTRSRPRSTSRPPRTQRFRPKFDDFQDFEVLQQLDDFQDGDNDQDDHAGRGVEDGHADHRINELPRFDDLEDGGCRDFDFSPTPLRLDSIVVLGAVKNDKNSTPNVQVRELFDFEPAFERLV